MPFLESDGERMRVKLTVHSLHGIKVSKEILTSHEVSAAVAFAGSATDMEVHSSTLCSTSGRLMVESNPLCLIDCKDASISASWSEKEMSSADENLPHVTLSMPLSQQSQPVSLSKSNRESIVFKEASNRTNLEDRCQATGAVDAAESPLSSPQCRAQEHNVQGTTNNSSIQNSDTLWSSSKAVLPEIVELAVKVKVPGQEDSHKPHGIAFLVIYGHEESGSYIINLPVRLLNKPGDNQRLVGLSEDARLEVRVQLFPQAMRHAPTKPTLSIQALPSFHADECRVSPSAVKVRIPSRRVTAEKSEEEIRDFLRAQRRAMDVYVPVKDKDNKDEDFKKTSPTDTWKWTSLIENLFWTVDQCGVGAAVKSHFQKSSDITASSTIATQESFGF